MPSPLEFHFDFSSPMPRSRKAYSVRRSSSSTPSRSGGFDRFDQIGRWLANGRF